ncbi:hypothetical protein BDZ45DRAFT_632632 [Acephala macrosclerotiorum]|nr:hypothetical protein BDZ45DRAFT_632632 [Acephala macrosclerotiorum]
MEQSGHGFSLSTGPVNVGDGSKVMIGNFSGARHQREEILDWLAPDGLRLAQHKAHVENSRGRIDDTGKLFIEGGFEIWLRSGSTRLWIYGGVGSGKTILCSLLIDKMPALLSLIYPSITEHIVVYFYCSFRATETSDVSTFLKSILVQLCERRKIYPAVEDLWEASKPHQASRSNLLTTLLDVLKYICCPTETSKNGSEVGKSATSLRSTVTLIIDGLDEGIAGYLRTEFLDTLETISTSQMANFRIINVSREDAEIKSYMDRNNGWTWSMRTAADVEHEVYMFAKVRISRHRMLKMQNQTIQDLICGLLSKGAGGMFRLAALQMTQLELETNSLRSIFEDDIRNILITLPRSLDTFYDLIVRRIPQHLRTELEQVLKWLLYASRPLLVEEVVESCAMSISCRDGRPSIGKNRRHALDILDNLPGLVKLEPPFPQDNGSSPPFGIHVLTFAHFSVQEYIFPLRDVQRPGGECRFTEPLQDHQDIARGCLAYILHCFTERSERSKFFLRSYCWHYWAMHSKAVPDGDEVKARVTPESLRLHNSITCPELYEEGSERTAAEWSTFKECASCFTPNEYAKLIEALQDLKFPYEDTTETSQETNPNIERGFRAQMTSKSHRAIKLLIIQPAEIKNAPIECSLCLDFLENRPLFCAISHTWYPLFKIGDDSIRINGKLFQTQHIAEPAISKFRRKDRAQALWIDSICISYTDRDEVRSQLKFIADVFEMSQMVIAWLGEADEDTEEAMEYLEEDFPPTKNREKACEAISSLFQKLLWPRQWIIQELVVAKKVIVACGDHTSDLDLWCAIPRLVTKLFVDEGTSKAVVPSVVLKSWNRISALQVIRQRRLRKNEPQFLLPELLYLTRDHMVSRRTDRVISLLQLISPGERGDPFFASEALRYWDDSEGSLSFQLTVYIVEKYQSLYALSSAWPPRADTRPGLEDPVGFGTWTIHLHDLTTPLIPGPGNEDYNAGGKDTRGLFPLKVSGHDDGVLIAHGALIGIVEDSAYWSRRPLPKEFAKLDRNSSLFGVIADDKEGVSKLQTLRSIMNSSEFQADWMAPTGSGNPSVRARQGKGWHPSFRNRFERLRVRRSRGMPEPQSEFTVSANAFSCGGYAGIAPIIVKNGDIVVVLFGGRHPFVLREYDARRRQNPRYRLVAECYVDGIMHEEMVRAIEEDKSRAKEFWIV